MNKLKILFVILTILVINLKSGLSQKSIDLNIPLPVDSSVKIGKLSNGLTYYIKRNYKPEKRVELRLAVNAGSLFETDAQQGLAHFTEHMCFNGTKNFKKNELVNFLEQMGIKFGGDLNAYTSFAETVYMLQIPTDDKDLINKGFLVLEDWAHNVSFEPEEIDKERGVIIEEWRLGLGAEDRMRKKAFSVVLKDSRYAERIPIGKKEILQSFKYDTLTKFYHDWYRPDLMAVIVVGDINIKEIEQLIKLHFERIENPINKKPRIEYSIPDNKEPLISIETDPEATNNRVMFSYKKPKKIPTTLNDYRQTVINRLYNAMLNKRLQELTRKPDCPLIRANTSYGNFLARSNDAYNTGGTTKENQIEKGFESLLKENERVKRFGFTETEFKREKDEYLKNIVNRVNEINKTESGYFVQEYIGNFLEKRPIMGIKNELALLKLLLPDIKLEEVNYCAKNWITDDNLIIEIFGPQRANVRMPTKDTLLQILRSIKTKKLKPYVDDVSNEPLLAQKPKGGKVIYRKVNKNQDFTELTLLNGVKVVLKSTDYKNDEILLSAYSPGGTSLYSLNDFMSAKYSSSIIDASGIGTFNTDALLKKLQGKLVHINPYIDELKEGLNGKSSVADFETMLQLTYLYFTKPRKDTSEFHTFISKMKTRIKYIGENPQNAFTDTLMKLSTMNDPRTIVIPNLRQIEQIKLDDLFRIYCERFADASDFTFFIVGKFNADTIVPMVETYLGSLPSINRKESWKDVSPKFPTGITKVTFNKGIADKGMVGISINNAFEWNEFNRLSLTMMVEVLKIKLREKIREEEGGTYGLRIQRNIDQYPKPECNFLIQFGCDPGRAEWLVEQVFDVIENIQKNGPDTSVLGKVKNVLIREREVSIKENNFWLKKLESEFYNNDEIRPLNDYNAMVNKVTTEDIKKMAGKYMTLNHYVEVILAPEKK